MVDLAIRGARVLSPANGIDMVTDVSIIGTRIHHVGPLAQGQTAREEIDGKGYILSPGFIDFHVHGFAYFTDYGTYPDDVGVHSGVTTVVDQGSAGYLTFPAFHEFMVKHSATRVLSYLNIGAVGTIKGSMLPALHGPKTVDVGAVVDTIAKYPHIIKGIKTHAEMGGVARWGFRVLEKAKEAAKQAGVPCYVHTGRLIPCEGFSLPDADSIVPQALEYLEPGDILTHCFTGHPGGIVKITGEVHHTVRQAMADGLLLDVGYGEHFSFDIARKVLDQGIMPYLVSSDVHALFNKPHSLQATYGLFSALSHLLALGIPLNDLIAMVTDHPAKILGLDEELGRIEAGYQADLILFGLESGSFLFQDRFGVSVPASLRLEPKLTIRHGTPYSTQIKEESEV